MEPSIIEELNQEQPSPFHQQMLSHCMGLVATSRQKMSAYYPGWDGQDDVYNGIILPDAEDKRARDRKEPEKMVVPISYAQIQTFVAFCFTVLFQREYFYELSPFSVENERASSIAEGFLQRDLDYNNFRSLLYQFLIDIGRFGVGVLKVGWEENSKWQQVTEAPPPPEFMGMAVPTGPVTTKQKVVKYQGNRIYSISPYRFFPDPRMPIRRFQEGEFVASEDEFTYTQLKQMETDGLVAGIDHISSLTESAARNPARGLARYGDVRTVSDAQRHKKMSEVQGSGILTEVQVKLIPSKFMIRDKPLGPETYPVKYLVWYVNDSRIVRIEPFGYDHDQFTYSVAEFSPDMHHFINSGLSEVIDKLQSVITWFINSHITSVRKVIQNRLIIDPEMLEMDDIREHRSFIRMKPGSSRLGAERYVHQLQVQDVTNRHMEDSTALQGLVQLVSGISENALGQYHSGRRSAEEARNVNASAASRLKTALSVIYYSALEPLGRQMLSNLRQGLSMETYVRIWGLLKDPNGEGFLQFVRANGMDLSGDYDFEILDGTLPTEKMWQAQVLSDLLPDLMANPQLTLFLGFDIKKIVYEILRLRGIRHPEKFAAGTLQQQLLIQLSQQANSAVAGAPGNGQLQRPPGPREAQPSGRMEG